MHSLQKVLMVAITAALFPATALATGKDEPLVSLKGGNISIVPGESSPRMRQVPIESFGNSSKTDRVIWIRGIGPVTLSRGFPLPYMPCEFVTSQTAPCIEPDPKR